MWCCNKCDKSINFENKSNHFKSKAHKHKEKYSVIVKEFDFIRPNLNRIDYIINNCARDCCNRYFHIFENRCIYNFELTNGDFVNGIMSDEKFKKIVRENGFLSKLKIKIHSSLEKLNICYYLNFPIPIMHRQLFRII